MHRTRARYTRPFPPLSLNLCFHPSQRRPARMPWKKKCDAYPPLETVPLPSCRNSCCRRTTTSTRYVVHRTCSCHVNQQTEILRQGQESRGAETAATGQGTETAEAGSHGALRCEVKENGMPNDKTEPQDRRGAGQEISRRRGVGQGLVRLRGQGHGSARPQWRCHQDCQERLHVFGAGAAGDRDFEAPAAGSQRASPQHWCGIPISLCCLKSCLTDSGCQERVHAQEPPVHCF